LENHLNDLNKTEYTLRDFYDQCVRTMAFQWYMQQEQEAPHRLKELDPPKEEL
jgi:hypothetical protein